MRRFANALLILVLIFSAQPLFAAGATAATPTGLRFVPITPCRLIDTAAAPPLTVEEQTLRHVDLQSSRCGLLLPSYALHYSLQITTRSNQAPELLPAGTVPAKQATTLPAAANRRLDFAVPSASHIAVDVDGYYVSPGTPINPFDPPGAASASLPGAPAVSASSLRTLQPVTQTTHDGTNGDIFMNAATPFTATGVRLDGTVNSATPHIVARLGDSIGSAAFWVFNSSATPSDATAIIKAESNGHIIFPNGGYLDGKSSYLQGPAIPGNVVHDVTVLNPLDAAGGATSHVVFFNANSNDENGSPATTKFQAFTGGLRGQSNINYDSQLIYHLANAPFYHFRAYSVPESKDTFWVKGATDGTSVTQTRADMYVSGNVGVGTTAPGINGMKSTLTVQSATARGMLELATGQGDINGMVVGQVGFFATANTASNKQIGAILALTDGTTGANRGGDLQFWTKPDGGGLAAAMTIDRNGKLGIATATPTEKLDVTGNAHVSGNLNLGGNMTVTGTASLQNQSGLTIATTGTAQGHILSIAANSVGWTSNATNTGGVWNLDDTTKPGWFVTLDSGGDQFSVSRLPAGANPRTATQLLTLDPTGNMTVTGNLSAKYQDVAEWVPAGGHYTAGTVVTIDPEGLNRVTATTHAYDTAVAGVISSQPGLTLGEAGPAKALVATTGRVKVLVSAATGPIRAGDLLVTSDRPGMAMKSEPVQVGSIVMHRPGTLIGKALEPLASGEGQILVLLSLQ